MSTPIGMGGVVVGAIIGIIIAIPLLLMRLWRNAKNMPSEEKKKEVIEFIRQLKSQGLSFSERKRRLMEKGYVSDVAETLLAEAERDN